MFEQDDAGPFADLRSPVGRLSYHVSGAGTMDPKASPPRLFNVGERNSYRLESFESQRVMALPETSRRDAIAKPTIIRGVLALRIVSSISASNI